jgi:cell wall-associated NlpC family hydrolase
MTGEDLARAALALVGAPFRLHGRDPRHGLDCVGLVQAAADGCGHSVRLPNGYAVRSGRPPEIDHIAHSLALRREDGPTRVGDVLLLRPGPCQYHLAIALDEQRIVHAHAGLRKVVSDALPEAWQLVSRWRTCSID